LRVKSSRKIDQNYYLQNININKNSIYLCIQLTQKLNHDQFYFDFLFFQDALN